MVLDKQLQPVPAGQAGDLYIRGAGVSPGYWKDPGRTGEVFLNHPGDAGRLYKTGDLAQLGEDGLIYFLGREDSQVKSRGYRIELGEIESALSATGVLHECAVMALTSAGFDGVTVGCAYVAPPRVTPAALRQRLKKELPAYMIPSRWMTLEELPRNANGKIDRHRLREMLPLYESTAYRHA